MRWKMCSITKMLFPFYSDPNYRIYAYKGCFGNRRLRNAARHHLVYWFTGYADGVCVISNKRENAFVLNYLWN